MVVDDSPLMRQLLTALLTEDDTIEVVGTAPDPYVAREKIKRLHPDVLTLDVDMPGMNGLKFLENLMRLWPMPVIMVSSLTRDGATTTLRALELGAVDVVAKPHGDPRENIHRIGTELRAKVRAAAHVRLGNMRAVSNVAASLPALPLQAARCERGVIAIGASAGGTQAVGEILQRLPARMPPIVIVQHMPPRFTGPFADRLNEHCAMKVQEARDGDQLRPGMVFIAPGGQQTELISLADGYRLRVYEGEPVSLHRPSVDVLFDSAARAIGANALGVILTGMGSDGARGLSHMRRRGAWTLAQNQETSLVFGMPERAIREGGVCEILPLDRMAERLVEWAGVSADVEPGTS
ncbi:MAG: chemotaxis response regulator protein-glutamate methylesterase [Gammaproteobacteria bacterium]|nr:chemotaxis response regulator protein-glutamate methylesterase [Gammaproteobacteria bacterium]